MGRFHDRPQRNRRVATARNHGVLGAARPAVTHRGFGFTD
jgi:hypothetical protein